MRMVKCRNCANYCFRNPRVFDRVYGWCCKIMDDTYPDMLRDCEHFRVKTNADRIIGMSDEELAKWIVYITEGAGFDGYEERVSVWLKWLKEEVN